MSDATTSIEEKARLDALARYRILDTPEEPGFDVVVVVTKALRHTPIAPILWRT